MANAGKFNGKILGWVTGALALVVIGMTSSNASSRDDLVVNVSAVQEDTDNPTTDLVPPIPDELAEFADAPYGVDPIVTGPVSTAFKQQQDAANCDDAVWPNVPTVCFPD